MEKQNKKNPTKKAKLYVFLIRWWCAGAVFFFIGWGTTAGSRTSILDLVVLLAIAMGLFNSFIVNPAIKMLFNIGKQKEYKDMTVAKRVMMRLKDVGVALVTIALISWIYDTVNVVAIQLFNLSNQAVFLPTEPLLFGLFYALIMTLGGYVIPKILTRMKVKKS